MSVKSWTYSFFGNKHYKNIVGMFLISFIAGRTFYGINTFSGFDLGRSLVFPFVATLIPHVICLAALGIVWIARKRIWQSYYHMAWFIWAAIIAFTVWSKYLIDNSSGI